MRIIKDVELRKFVARQQTQFIAKTSDFNDEVIARLQNHGQLFGDSMPWSKTEQLFRFRPKEVTVWAGVNGHGKSLVTGQVALFLATQTPVMVASMEMPPESTIARMVRQASGNANPPDNYIRKVTARLGEDLLIYDQVGTVNPESVIGMIHAASVDYGVKHVFIDSLVTCGVDSEHNEPQKKFVAALSDAAKEHGIHIHLIHHIRKPMSEVHEPSKFDIKGAGEISDLADNVIIVWRNMPKVVAERNGEDVEPEIPDCYLKVDKQRHGEWTGRFAFWFHPASQQWCPAPTTRPTPWPNAQEAYTL